MMTNQIHPPTVILFEEPTVYGPVYRPVNEYARCIASMMGISRIPADRLPFIEKLGYRIEQQEREVIPFPRKKS